MDQMHGLNKINSSTNIQSSIVVLIVDWSLYSLSLTKLLKTSLFLELHLL